MCADCRPHQVILVTFVNSKRADYAYTWAAHLQIPICLMMLDGP